MDWILDTLWMGLRFDLLILGFILLFLILLKKWRWIWVREVWGGICLVYLMGSWFLPHGLEHPWSQDFAHLAPILSFDGWIFKSLSLGFAAALFWLGLKLWNQLVMQLQTLKRSHLIGLLALAVFMARGSLAEDHLRRNHCDGRPNKTIRSFCMNPVYTITKPRNQEFAP